MQPALISIATIYIIGFIILIGAMIIDDEPDTFLEHMLYLLIIIVWPLAIIYYLINKK